MAERIKQETKERGIKKVSVFESKDGAIFKTQKEVLEHEREIDFHAWYADDSDADDGRFIIPAPDEEELHGTGVVLDSHCIAEWLKKNWKPVLHFYGVSIKPASK